MNAPSVDRAALAGPQPGVPQYAVHAIRYAHMADRLPSDNLMPRDPKDAEDAHDGRMPMDFFVWLIQGAGRTVLVDTGFSAATARLRGREKAFLRCPIDALQSLGVAAADVQDVVITHLHYDHAGNLDRLPKARFHVQQGEVQYATGPCMCFPVMRHAYHVDDVVTMVRRVYEDRVQFHDGDAMLAPGIELLGIGGHTQGLQSVRVHTARGWIVLASDAAHYYANAMGGRLFPIVYSVPDMLAGHRRLLELAGSADHFVPGHDPLVLQRYPLRPGDAHGIACLHEPPRTPGATADGAATRGAA